MLLVDQYAGGRACLNGIMKACARSGQLDKGLMILKEAIQKGSLPSTASFDALILAASRAGRPDVGINIFKDMKAAGIMANEIT